MNTITPDETSRPFGFWLKAVDRLMAIEFAAAFESEGITRREWRLLNIVDGTVPGAPRKNDRPLPEHKLGRLIELGWVTDAEGSWTLTDEGRAAKERLGGIVDGIRAKVTDAVPADDLATTMATLEQLARAFGWNEETPLPRGRSGRGHGARGYGHGRRHGVGHGFDRGRFGYPGHRARHTEGGPHAHRGHDDGHPRTGFARFTQDAYERGFDAGIIRARHDR